MASHEAQAMKKKFSEFVLKLSGTEEAPVSVEEMRATYDGFAADLTGKPSGVTWAEVDVAGVPAVWTDPAGGATDRVVQYVHGGGYVIGSAKAYQSFAGHIAKAVGCRVLNVDYRLAPEHPHPAPVEDSSTAYRWLLSQGYDPSHVAIAGDSAGGGLTLTTLLALRQAETPQPAASVPISPWADMEVTGATMVTNAETDFLQQPMLLGMAELFLGGHDPRDPLAAPLHADFAELPPMYIQAGGDETLLDDARRVADAATSAGVDVTLEVFPEMQHVFQLGAGGVPEADDAVAKIGVFLRSRLGLA